MKATQSLDCLQIEGITAHNIDVQAWTRGFYVFPVTAPSKIAIVDALTRTKIDTEINKPKELTRKEQEAIKW